jgi:carbamoyltransferase
MKIIGLIGTDRSPSHDSAVAAIEDGRVKFAIEEERIIRKKKAIGLFPLYSLNACLEYCNWKLNDIDAISFGWDFTDDGNYPIKDAFIENIPLLITSNIVSNKVHFVNHHLAHAISAWSYSNGKPTLAIVCDGRGEKNSISGYLLSVGKKPHQIFSHSIKESIGLFYESAASYCGLGYMSAGKLMGLASYGTEFSTSDTINNIMSKGDGFQNIGEDDFAVDTSVKLFEAWIKEFSRNYYPFERRQENSSILPYANFASMVQSILENSILSILELHLKKYSSVENIVLAGGVFLNCKMNEIIINKYNNYNVSICPAANDSGAAIGAALFTNQNLAQNPINIFNHNSASFGCHFTKDEIINTAKLYNLKTMIIQNPEFQIAEDLKSGKIVLWYWGRDEIGPRALCNRSILADPRQYNTVTRLNKIKDREQWRPLAPVLLEEHYGLIFDSKMDENMRYMLVTSKVKDSFKNKITGVVHSDGTSRPQIIEESSENPIKKVLRAFSDKTDCPCLINTSLNTFGEPIAFSPNDLFKIMFQIGTNVSAYLNGLYFTK